MTDSTQKQQLLIMLDMQDAMNKKVNEDWRKKSFEWYRAMWVECAELMDHYGWKWWKKQTPDMDQVNLELVDIWHFGLSDLLQHSEPEAIAEQLVLALQASSSQKDFRDSLEAFTSATLQHRRFIPEHFTALLASANMSFAELYRHYVGKNVLNFFRQDNGYKEGSYIKVWQGKEDNEHLADIVLSLNSEHPDYRTQVYHELEKRYATA